MTFLLVDPSLFWKTRGKLAGLGLNPNFRHDNEQSIWSRYNIKATRLNPIHQQLKETQSSEFNHVGQ
jgi:hypothetical protein